MNLAFIVTARCNAQCAHCSSGCGPDQSRELPTQRILRLMDEAAALEPDAPLSFGITGGEPFLDLARLLTIVAHGARVGGSVSCVTNAFWASSDERARKTLASLQQAGLATLGVSTSRFHERYVKRSRVERALDCARELGIRTVLKVAVSRSDGAELEAWARRARADTVEVFPVLPYLRDGQQWEDGEFVRAPGLPEGRCPSARVTVREDGAVLTCCHPGAESDFLRLGTAGEDPLGELYDRFHLQGQQQLLRRKGPIHFARGIQAAGLGHLLRPAYASVCDLCAHIAREPRLARVAADMAQEFEREEMHTLFGGLMRLSPG